MLVSCISMAGGCQLTMRSWPSWFQVLYKPVVLLHVLWCSFTHWWTGFPPRLQIPEGVGKRWHQSGPTWDCPVPGGIENVGSWGKEPLCGFLCAAVNTAFLRVTHSPVELGRREVKHAPLNFLSPEDCVFTVKEVRINQKRSFKKMFLLQLIFNTLYWFQVYRIVG